MMQKTKYQRVSCPYFSRKGEKVKFMENVKSYRTCEWNKSCSVFNKSRNMPCKDYKASKKQKESKNYGR